MYFSLVASVAAAPDLPGFAKLIEKYGAVVVHISATPGQSRPWSEDRLEQSGFPNALSAGQPVHGQVLEDPRKPGLVASSLGSGFVISKDGYILTSAHVVKEVAEITVKLRDGREFVAKVVGSDRRSDVALLKIKADRLDTAIFGDPAKLKVGDWVLAIGSPFGFEYSASSGIVSATGRNLPNEHYIPFIQTDAAINPGNSGGPLFNLKGEVIGINAQIFSRTGGFMGVSFAVPIDLALHIGEQLKTHGYVKWGWIGVAIQDVTRDLAVAFEIDEPAGALITDILPGGPASKSLLKVGDIVLDYQGRAIERSTELPQMVGLTPPGTPATLVVFRGGKRQALVVSVGELVSKPSDRISQGRTSGRGRKSLGLVLAELTAGDRKRENLTYGDDAGPLLRPGPVPAGRAGPRLPSRGAPPLWRRGAELGRDPAWVERHPLLAEPARHRDRPESVDRAGRAAGIRVPDDAAGLVPDRL